jgi:hypothetical protein
MTGADDVRFPQYRANLKKVPGFTVLSYLAPLAFVVEVGNLLLWMAGNGLPGKILFGAPAVVILGYVLGRILAWRIATITGPDHVVVQRLFGSHRTAWSDIVAIEIASTPGTIGTRNAPFDFAVLQDRDGHRIVLPWVNGNAVPDLHAEVRALRELWKQLRGDDWSPTSQERR